MSFIDEYPQMWDWTTEQEQIEQNWAEGIHMDRAGNEHRIEQMERFHLENTINYFNKLGYDTSKLKAVLDEQSEE